MNTPTEAVLTQEQQAWAEVGRPHPHESAALHVLGEALYTDDLPELHGTLHAARGGEELGEVGALPVRAGELVIEHGKAVVVAQDDPQHEAAPAVALVGPVQRDERRALLPRRAARHDEMRRVDIAAQRGQRRGHAHGRDAEGREVHRIIR